MIVVVTGTVSLICLGSRTVTETSVVRGCWSGTWTSTATGTISVRVSGTATVFWTGTIRVRVCSTFVVSGTQRRTGRETNTCWHAMTVVVRYPAPQLEIPPVQKQQPPQAGTMQVDGTIRVS